jgi:GT2 family glycosyltransferase
MTNFRLSVVIPTKDRPLDLARCLAALERQATELWEVLVISNGRQHPVMQSNEKFRLVSTKEWNLTKLFNLGWQATSGEIIAYLNDDSEPEDGWARCVQETMEEFPEAVAVGGPTVDVRPREIRTLSLRSSNSRLIRFMLGIYEKVLLQGNLNEVGRFSRYGAYSIGTWLEDSKRTPSPVVVDHLTITNAAFRREVFERVGPFDENFHFNHADGDLFYRIKRRGLQSIFNPNCRVTHHVNPTGPVRSAYSIGRDTAYFLGKDFPPRKLVDVPGFALMLAFMSAFFLTRTVQKGSSGPLRAVPGMINGLATALRRTIG